MKVFYPFHQYLLLSILHCILIVSMMLMVIVVLILSLLMTYRMMNLEIHDTLLSAYLSHCILFSIIMAKIVHFFSYIEYSQYFMIFFLCFLCLYQKCLKRFGTFIMTIHHFDDLRIFKKATSQLHLFSG